MYLRILKNEGFIRTGGTAFLHPGLSTLMSGQATRPACCPAEILPDFPTPHPATPQSTPTEQALRLTSKRVYIYYDRPSYILTLDCCSPAPQPTHNTLNFSSTVGCPNSALITNHQFGVPFLQSVRFPLPHSLPENGPHTDRHGKLGD